MKHCYKKYVTFVIRFLYYQFNTSKSIDIIVNNILKYKIFKINKLRYDNNF